MRQKINKNMPKTLNGALPLLDDFLLNLKVNNYSQETIYNYERDLDVFQDFLNDAGIPFSRLTKRDVLNYKAYLISIDRQTAKEKKAVKKLNAYSINRMLSSLRSYFKYLIDHGCMVEQISLKYIGIASTIFRIM